MALLDEIKAKAASLKKTIVLCEGEDRRVVEAAAQITKEGIAKIVLIGNEEEAKKVAPDVDLTGITLIDPLTSEKTAEYAKILYEARKAKGMTEEQAAVQAKDRTMFGALMLKAGDVDGYVSGACHSTANTLRPGLQVVKTAPGIKTVSSCFIIIAPEGGNKYNPGRRSRICRLRNKHRTRRPAACRHRGIFRKDGKGHRGHRAEGGNALVLDQGFGQRR